jgi:RNA polymerase sigma-54 factor
MNMKQSLQLRVGQQLTMTPQLQQAIRLLQLPAAELNLEIRDALESNVMLELEDDTDTLTESINPPDTPEPLADSDPSEALLGSDAPDASRLGENIPGDERWEENMTGATALSAPDYSQRPETLENYANAESSLQDHLRWQLELSGLSERDQKIGEVLIDAIDDKGHLSEPLETLSHLFPAAFELDGADIKSVLTFIQHLDPIGVGARDARESMRIQVDALPESTPHRDTAQQLIQHHLELLGQGQQAALRKKLAINQTALEASVALIQSLNPHPGAEYSQLRTEYVIPDCFVEWINGRWQVEINPHASPKLQINEGYAGLVQRGDSSTDNHLLREHLQEARWLIKSLQSRNETLRKVAETIVEAQQAFLEDGEEAMQPLVLREVAEAIDMHESTVSRITSQKYMHTPQGTLEFKHFFSSHVPTVDGGECSATSIRARIRRLVAAEHPAKPLSDSRLTATLREEGINVARRTVAKYREVMGIAASTDRKRLV